MRPVRWLTWIVALVALHGCATFYAPRTALPIADVVTTSKSNTPPEQVIQSIKASATTFALRGSDFAKLKALSVADPVLDYLQQAFVDDLDLLTRYWVLGESLGGCTFCYPQPVDIDSLRSGFGNVSASPPGRWSGARPPGTPDWVPLPPTARPGQRLSVDQIVAMANEHVPDSEIVQRIHESHLTRVVGVGGLTFRTRPIAGLGGAELARLKGQGLADAVLDALQEQFLAEFIEAERMRYQNLGKGPGAMS